MSEEKKKKPVHEHPPAPALPDPSQAGPMTEEEIKGTPLQIPPAKTIRPFPKP